MFKRMREFLKDVNLEVKKVAFPKKDELIGSTWVVIVFVFVISIYLGVVDLALSELVKYLFR